MRLDADVFIRGNGVRLPTTLTVADAIRTGDCDPRLVRRTEVVSVAVSPDESAAEMAVAAATTALDRAGATGSDIARSLHADSYSRGQELWPVATDIARETVGNQCPALEIKQMSNGGVAAMDLAIAYLTAMPGRGDALLTTADRFCLPGINRWSTDPGTPYADGGTALVLSRKAGYARILSIVMLSDSGLEGIHRGDEPFGPAPFTHRKPVDFENAKRAFTRQHGLSYALERVSAWQRTTIKEALSDARVDLDQIDWVVLPHFGWRRLELGYFRELGIDPARTTWEWSRTVGHLGAGDQFASFGHLVDTGRAKPGDRCLLVSVGAGYTWGCAVVEVIEQPAWADLTYRPSPVNELNAMAAAA
jgi:3-oxoacyl-[acyl-carrier-protein] synthase-3